MTREARYGRGKRLEEKEITREVYGEDVVWMEWWEVWGEILREVGEELIKMKVSFSGEEILKGGWY